MTAIEFWKKYGPKKVREVCGLAGTTFEYFEHIAHARKRPSQLLADALSDASARLTEDRIDASSMRGSESKREAKRQLRAAAFAASLAEARA